MYIDEFVEDLSNCIGFISGDELILKKMRYDFEYEIRTRNRDKKLGSIKWDIDNQCIVLLLNNKSYTFDRYELTIEKIKKIGNMINKAFYNMNESVEREYGYHDIGNIIEACFHDDEFGKPKDFGYDSNNAGEFVGRPMEEYDVLVFYKWNYDTDTLTVHFNYGQDELKFENFLDNVKVKKMAEADGMLRFGAKVEKSNELENFIDDVTEAWQDCFSY